MVLPLPLIDYISLLLIRQVFSECFSGSTSSQGKMPSHLTAFHIHLAHLPSDIKWHLHFDICQLYVAPRMLISPYLVTEAMWLLVDSSI